MKTIAVIEHFNVIDNIYPGFFPGYIAFLMGTFGLEGMKETFNNGIVPAIASTAHRLIASKRMHLNTAKTD